MSELAAPVRRLPARDGIDTMIAGAHADVVAMSDLAPGAVTVRHLRPSNLQPGVRYRVIFPDSARTTPGVARYLRGLAAAGVKVRTMPQLPMDVLVIDAAVAVMPADTGPGSVVAMRLPSVVTTATELFERLWPDAVPLAAAQRTAAPDLTAREHEMLRLLAIGATDEVAAAQLGCSVRTIRRMVAQLMHRLGARSRFQAGVKAADRGWLMDRAC